MIIIASIDKQIQRQESAASTVSSCCSSGMLFEVLL